MQLLVSVRNRCEAEEALAGGADWIDMKEPSLGALGAVALSTAGEIVETVSDRAPVSAAAGELIDWPRSSARELLGLQGVKHLKLGMAGCAELDWRSRWREAQREIHAAGQRLVAVVYADARAAGAPRPEEILSLAVEMGAPWALWDTFDKDGGAILSVMSAEILAAQILAVRTAGLGAVIAGSVTADMFTQLPLERIDMIAVRGAACVGGRESLVSRERVSQLRTALSRHVDCSDWCDARCDSRDIARLAIAPRIS